MSRQQCEKILNVRAAFGTKRPEHYSPGLFPRLVKTSGTFLSHFTAPTACMAQGRSRTCKFPWFRGDDISSETHGTVKQLPCRAGKIPTCGRGHRQSCKTPGQRYLLREPENRLSFR